MSSGVYSIRNIINNKSYIGSSNDLKIRFIAHKSSLKHNSHYNKYLQAAWNKYGEESFEFSVLYYCPVEYIHKLEQKCIDSFKPEYNIRTNVEGSPMLGRNFSKEHVSKIQRTRRETGVTDRIASLNKGNSYAKGTRLSSTQVKTLHEQKKNKRNTIREIEQYSPEGVLLAVHDTSIIAAESVECTYKAIHFACQGKIKKLKGYIWKYKQDTYKGVNSYG